MSNVPLCAQESGEEVRILFVGAHPDDCDVKAGEPAALLAGQGHAVKFASLTNDDAGHHEMGSSSLAKRRCAEAKEAARRLGIDAYEMLHYHDGELMPTLKVRGRDSLDPGVERRRRGGPPAERSSSGPSLRGAPSNGDAAYMGQVPNVLSGVEPTGSNPVSLYFEDGFEKRNPFEHDITITIDEAIDRKISALDVHESQFYEWLPWVRDVLDEASEEETACRQWLKMGGADSVSGGVRESLAEWYGKERAQDVQYVESFQIAEFGRHPTDDELRRLFPMLSE